MITLGVVLEQATQRLAMAGVDQPRRDARLLVSELLNITMATMIAYPETALSAEHAAIVDVAISRRVKREPVSRILGQREFFGLPFVLGEGTLDPRPDSEVIVESVLVCLKGEQAPSILDLGTGTGCLLLSALSEIDDATGVGVDISPNAVGVAQKNAHELGLADRAQFIQQDWMESDWVDVLPSAFDLVISNPPYIPEADIARLEPEVTHYDPIKALEGGVDGLDPYRHLIPCLRSLLKPGGHAVFEVGKGQSCDVAQLFEVSGFDVLAKPLDLGGIERCIVARFCN